jgi:NAD(P)-dependent dehydrogenase (short-subunit alcohol dehydrogenase family)
VSRKVWRVTGTARGIGAEIVSAAVRAGDCVVGMGRDPDGIAKRFGAHGSAVHAVRLDHQC